MKEMPKPIRFVYICSIVFAALSLLGIVIAVVSALWEQIGVPIFGFILSVLCVIGIIQKSRVVYWLTLVGAGLSVFQDVFRIAAIATIAPILIPILMIHLGVMMAIFVALRQQTSRDYFGIGKHKMGQAH